MLSDWDATISSIKMIAIVMRIDNVITLQPENKKTCDAELNKFYLRQSKKLTFCKSKHYLLIMSSKYEMIAIYSMHSRY